MRHVLAGLLVMAFGSAGAEPAVTFPGPVAEARAPNSEMRVTYVDTGDTAEGVHEYSLRLQYPGGRTDEIDVFTRSVEVSWSPSGEALAVTDLVSSNVSDCYVFTPGPDATRKVSLTNVVTQGRFPGPAWALQHSSRGSVACDGWTEPDKVHFVLEGTGDDNPHGFRYAFTYDSKTGATRQDRPPRRRR